MCENPETTPTETTDTGTEFITETYSIPAQWIAVMSGSEVIAFDDLLSECEILSESNPTESVYTVTLRAPREAIERMRTQIALWASKYDNGETDDSVEHTMEILKATLG